MRPKRVTPGVLAILAFWVFAQPIFARTTTLKLLSSMPDSQVSNPRRIVIAASTLLDGKGHVLHNTRIVVADSKILTIDPKAGPVDYDLRGLTVLPGWIDAHVHITWSFGKDGKNAGGGGTTPEAVYATASNAWLTLMAGFTN